MSKTIYRVQLVGNRHKTVSHATFKEIRHPNGKRAKAKQRSRK